MANRFLFIQTQEQGSMYHQQSVLRSKQTRTILISDHCGPRSPWIWRLIDLYSGIFNRLVDFWSNMKSVYLWNHEARADDYFCAKRHLIGQHKEYTCLG